MPGLAALGAVAGLEPSVLQPVHRSEDALEVFLLLCGGFLFGLYLMYDGYDTWKLLRLMQDTPRTTVRSMPVGLVELQGTVRAHDRTVDPPYHDRPCVYVDWEAQRREKRRDDDGNVHYTWATVASGTRTLPFELEDDTGSVLVRADEGAAFDVDDGDNETTVTFGRGESPDRAVLEYVERVRTRRRRADDEEGLLDEVTDVVSEVAGAEQPLRDTSRRRRYRQTVLPVGNEAYVLGGARPREGAGVDAGQQDLLAVGEDTATEEFLVADDTEPQLTEEYSTMAPLKGAGGLALSAVTLYLLLSWYAVPLS